MTPCSSSGCSSWLQLHSGAQALHPQEGTPTPSGTLLATQPGCKLGPQKTSPLLESKSGLRVEMTSTSVLSLAAAVQSPEEEVGGFSAASKGLRKNLLLVSPTKLP